MLIVDAYNVLHVTGVLPPDLAGLEAPDLADLIAESRWGRHQVVVLCDGTKPAKLRPHGRTGIRVHYAGAGVSADAAIERMVNESSHPRRLTVVSNDRAVQRSARRRGAAILRADAFLAQLAHDASQPRRGRRATARREPGPLTSKQVDAWLRYFGLDPAE
ncbi:MAG: NYN domain-containing protein [Phycisphaerales bacterium]